MIVLPVDCAIKSGPRGCGKSTQFISSLILHNTTKIVIIIQWNVLFVENMFWWLLRRVKNLLSTACKHYRKCDVNYRYLHIELIWCLLMVQYLQNNIIMKWNIRFINFTGWIPLKYGSTTTPPIHCQKNLPRISHCDPKNLQCKTYPEFCSDKFSKQVLIIRRALCQRIDGTRFTKFNGWIPLKYGSTTTPLIIAHCPNLWCQASYFTLRSKKPSNIRHTQVSDLLPDEFSKQVYIRRALY